MKKYISITGLLLLAISITTMAQEGDQQRYAPVHLSFITPLGTNGLESWNTTNSISLNVIAGLSGGLKGIELGGFANALRGDMNGIQVAGFCNNTFGEAKGLEVAGFWNYNQKTIEGIQAAGFANVAIAFVDGFQVSGFANYSRGASFGQASGFANLSTDDVSGGQLAGFANLVTGKMLGIQGSGFANLATGSVSGIQVAGFTNVATGKMQGVQASGFLNYAKKVKGVQFGFINVADTIESGIPIGFFSFVRDGYRCLQFGGNETLHSELSFKSGTRQFYNIFTTGATIRRNSLRWGWGYGIGSILPIANRFDLSIEAISYHINQDRWFSGHMNMVNKVNSSVSFAITRIISVYAGPSFNVSIADNHYADESPSDSWKIFSREYHRNTISMFPGLSAGIRIGAQ